MSDNMKKESYEIQLERFIKFLNKQDGKLYKKKISSFRKDMNFENRFNEKYRLKYQVLKLVDDANKSKDLKVKVSEPSFDYETDTITIKFKATRKPKTKIEKVENKVTKIIKPKINEYKYVVDFEIKNIGWFKRVKHIEQIHKTYKATDLEQLDKQVMKDIDNLTLQLKQQYGGKVIVILPYKINGRTPVEPFND